MTGSAAQITRALPLAAGLLAVALLPGTARAQLSPACDMGCPQFETCGILDAECHGRNAARTAEVTQCQTAQNVCMGKYTLFGGYLDQMGAGVPIHSLPSFLVEMMSPHFSGISVSDWRFGYSNRQPINNATTDCDRTYFNDQGTVNHLKDGKAYLTTAKDEIGWLIHEIRHYEQCVEVGGRDYFSELWWGDLSETDLSSMDMMQIHDQMAMEQDAMERAEAVMDQLFDCCIHPVSGKLISPLEVVSTTPSSLSKSQEETIEIGVEVEGGAEPLTYEWSSKCRPGVCFNFSPVSSASADDDRIDFGGLQEGMHTVRLRVIQAEGSLTTLPTRELTWEVTVNPPPFQPLQAVVVDIAPFAGAGSCDLEATFTAPRDRILSARAAVTWQVKIQNVGDAECGANQVSLERSGGNSRDVALVGGPRGVRDVPALRPGGDTILEFPEDATGRGSGTYTYELRYQARIDDADAGNHSPVATITFR